MNTHHSYGISDLKYKMTGRILFYLRLPGSVIESQTLEKIFLDHSQVIWSQAMGDPKAPTESSNIEKYTEKLNGKYSWPFKVPIPREIAGKSSTSSAMQTFKLPATFSERHAKVGVHYEIRIHVRRSTFRADSK